MELLPTWWSVFCSVYAFQLRMQALRSTDIASPCKRSLAFALEPGCFRPPRAWLTFTFFDKRPSRLWLVFIVIFVVITPGRCGVSPRQVALPL